MKQNNQHNHNRYKKISHDQRTQIINELTKNGKTLKEVYKINNL